MNKRMFVAWLAVICSIAPAKAQLSIKNKSSDHFLLPGLQMTFSNNFVSSGHTHSPTIISLPFKDEYFTIYGRQLILSAFKRDSLQRTEIRGEFFIDSSQRDINTFLLEDIQARIIKNGAVLRDWQYVQKMPSFEDSSVVYKANPRKGVTSYWLVNDNLQIGDSMLIELRKDTAQPFLRLHARREDAHTQPFMISYQSDSALTELVFIRSVLLNHMNETYENEFYQDWPGKGVYLDKTQLSANTRLAFNFRKEAAGSNDSVFLYHILGGQYKDTDWQKTDGLILLASLRPDANYRLEVKYADGHGRVSVYTFYTPPLWYQAFWFRAAMVILVAVILLLAFFLLMAEKNKRRMKLLQLEVQALYAQMNPHFLFNALGSIQGLMNDGQTGKANKYLTGFAGLLRSSVTLNRRAFVPLSIELKNLGNYIELERLRFDFRYQLDISPGIRADDVEVPPLLAQPLIENAVKHGLSGKRENGTLCIQITKENADLLFLVIDDGDGFDAGELAEGHGIRLTQERIALFNRMYRYKKMELGISSAASGTRCCIRFKNCIDND